MKKSQSKKATNITCSEDENRESNLDEDDRTNDKTKL